MYVAFPLDLQIDLLLSRFKPLYKTGAWFDVLSNIVQKLQYCNASTLIYISAIVICFMLKGYYYRVIS